MKRGDTITTDLGQCEYVGESAAFPEYVRVRQANPFSDRRTVVETLILRSLVRAQATSREGHDHE